MNQLALKNINTLLDINDKTLFIFNNKEITINTDETTEHVNENNVNTEYALYFTFNHLLCHGRLDFELVNILNTSLDNLYENESFIKLIENDSNLEEIMDDISLKLDVMTERYRNNICNRVTRNLASVWDYLLSEFIKNMPHNIKGVVLIDHDSDSGPDNDSDKESGDESDKESDNESDKESDNDSVKSLDRNEDKKD